MGARKRNTAEKRKEAAKNNYQAVLRNCPTSPRKMRLVTGLISGKEVNKALDILKFSKQEASRRLEKLLLSAIANWQAKNEGVRIEESNLFVKKISVDGGRTMKRLQTAPQGRAYRVRKRSNHVTLVLDSMNKEVENTSN
ncbi:MAG: 50S ribosomal protein L22 [Bacteroidales bacterium]|nr:50S ribosomal protein L22 [Bacteroidales bacterium]